MNTSLNFVYSSLLPAALNFAAITIMMIIIYYKRHSANFLFLFTSTAIVFTYLNIPLVAFVYAGITAIYLMMYEKLLDNI